MGVSHVKIREPHNNIIKCGLPYRRSLSCTSSIGSKSMEFEDLRYSEVREFSSRHMYYSRVKSKRITQRSFAFAVRERVALQAHGFENLFQVYRATVAREITVH